MSRRRVTAPAASFVWTVDRTRWPVSAGLHRDVGGFVVANFAHHHHVRVLTQNLAQGRGKRQADGRLHLNLVHAEEVVFDGVLDGHEVAVGCI